MEETNNFSASQNMYTFLNQFVRVTSIKNDYSMGFYANGFVFESFLKIQWSNVPNKLHCNMIWHIFQSIVFNLRILYRNYKKKIQNLLCNLYGYLIDNFYLIKKSN